MKPDPYRYFRIEAREILDAFVKDFLDLERDGATPDVVSGILRRAHTLKGASRVVSQPEIANDAHAIEELLDPFRGQTGPLTREGLEELLGYIDDIKERVDRLVLPVGDSGENSQGTEPVEASTIRDVSMLSTRIELDEIDKILDGVGEMRSRLGALRATMRELNQTAKLAGVISSALTVTPGVTKEYGLAESGAARARAVAIELRAATKSLEERFDHDLQQIELELREVHGAVEHLRLIPVGVLFADLERAVRDVAQAQGKSVRFEASGAGVRLDTQILDGIQMALQQLVRNAVAHGIETESERRAARKQPVGHVTLGVERSGRRVLFICRDDGRGIDLEAVRSVARTRGAHARGVEALGADGLIELLLRGGISTSKEVTELSGRGIGFDIVRELIERTAGKISVDTEEGVGTTITLDLPLTVVSLEAIAVETDGSFALIPFDAVIKTARVAREEIRATQNGSEVMLDDTAVPFLSLSSALSGASMSAADQHDWTVIFVQGVNGAAGLGVSSLLGTSEIIVRPLPGYVVASPIISGLWFDGEGVPRLVLDPAGIVTEARNARGAITGESEPELLPMLVIDDSLTTRMLETSILESAGYLVEAASSAEEGLEKAKQHRYLLFLVDVEMPGIDGFTFVSQVKADPNLRDIPAILVTSRSSPEDRQRGHDAGASAYITKGEFDQDEFLAHIRRLVAR